MTRRAGRPTRRARSPRSSTSSPRLAALGVTVVELLPGPPERSAGGQLLGLHAAGVRRRPPPVRGRRRRRPRSWPTLVAAAHEHDIEVWLDVVFNHTTEVDADAARPTACAASPTATTTGSTRDGSYIETTGCGNDIDAASPVAAGPRSLWSLDRLADLGVDGFRFDLAAGARPRDRPFVARLDGVGGRAGRGADRRAVGRRRHLPARPGLAGRGLAAVERPLPRGRPRVPARRAGTRAGAASSACRAAPTCSTRRCESVNFLDLPRRLHAVRPRRLRPQAQRGQRLGRHRRRRRQPLVELRLGGRRRRARRGAGAAPAPAAQRVVPAGDVARRADGRRWATSSGARRAATTTPTTRTTRRRGSTGSGATEFADLERFVGDAARPARTATRCSSQPTWWGDAVRFFGTTAPPTPPTRRARWRGRSATSTSSPTRGGSR